MSFLDNLDALSPAALRDRYETVVKIAQEDDGTAVRQLAAEVAVRVHAEIKSAILAGSRDLMQRAGREWAGSQTRYDLARAETLAAQRRVMGVLLGEARFYGVTLDPEILARPAESLRQGVRDLAAVLER